MGALNGYLSGSIHQQIERGKRLLLRIPTSLPTEFYLLAQNCQKQIDQILDELELLIQDPLMSTDANQPERLRRFRRAVDDMTLIETTGIAALERFSRDEDIFLNQLIGRITREISYPLLPPTVASLSQDYFHIYLHLNLLLIPLSEGDFLLHLPDLYHELGHPLLLKKHDPRIGRFQDALFEAFHGIMIYLTKEIEKEGRRRGPDDFAYYLETWSQSWRDWIIELFCDLFAVYTAGPTFVWSHFHLCAKMGSDAFEVPLYLPTTHPPDDARMRTMLYGLELLGFNQEVMRIQQQWDQLLELSGWQAEPNYDRCFPDDLLEMVASKALHGVQAMGCRVASPRTTDPIYSLLNQAWDTFWEAPISYPEWESQARQQLYQLCMSRPAAVSS